MAGSPMAWGERVSLLPRKLKAVVSCVNLATQNKLRSGLYDVAEEGVFGGLRGFLQTGNKGHAWDELEV